MIRFNVGLAQPGIAVVLLLLISLPCHSEDLDSELASALARAGFTGAIETTLSARLGRPIDLKLANLGRLLFFDKISSLHSDNACAACHAPSSGFGDTQSIAIGVQNNNLVGQHRSGPRNHPRRPWLVDRCSGSSSPRLSP